MMSQGKRERARQTAATLCMVLLVGCASPTPVTPTASPGVPHPSGSIDPLIVPTPSSQPLEGDPLPADIVSAIDAIVGAASLDDAIAATRVVLERSGVVITDDPASAARSPAGIYIDTDQLATMAHEARSRAGLVTFAQFADTFGALALLPPNDGLLDRLTEPVASPDPDAVDSFELDLDGQPLLLAEFVTDWVNRALVEYPSDDPLMTALTAPALYLAELAARQYEPVDLREPFMPSSLELGALDITLLIAGLRTSLIVGAEASALGPNSPLAQAGTWDVAPRLLAALDPTACGEISRRLNAGVPVLPDVGAFVAGEVIKGFAEATVRDMFKNGGSISKAVAPAFEALGVLFRVHALWLLYQHTEVTLEIEPATIHKPIGLNAPVAAYLVAGISDAEWAKEVENRNSSPWATALKACARLLGIPVTSDLVDIGEATSTWRASWTMPEGGAHAKFEGCQFLPSCDRNTSAAVRLERALTKRNDHSGQDTVIVEIKPEKEADHPGEEQIAPVRVCAHLRTDKPPDIGTLLNALTAGQVEGFGIGGIASLASSVANILLGWWQFVFTIDTCAYTAVTFHVPQPGNWQGTITANYEFHESTTIRSGAETFTHTRSTDITDTFYVGGDDRGINASARNILAARQYTRGGDVWRDIGHHEMTNASGCSYTTDYVFEAGGGWSFDGDTSVEIVLQPSGIYQLVLDTSLQPPEEIHLAGTGTTTITDNGSIYECEGFGTSTVDTEVPPNGGMGLAAASRGLLIEGQLDPLNPGSVLKGSLTFRDPNDPQYVTTVRWDLTRDTPIVLPGPSW